MRPVIRIPRQRSWSKSQDRQARPRAGRARVSLARRASRGSLAARARGGRSGHEAEQYPMALVLHGVSASAAVRNRAMVAERQRG